MVNKVLQLIEVDYTRIIIIDHVEHVVDEISDFGLRRYRKLADLDHPVDRRLDQLGHLFAVELSIAALVEEIIDELDSVVVLCVFDEKYEGDDHFVNIHNVPLAEELEQWPRVVDHRLEQVLELGPLKVVFGLERELTHIITLSIT